MFVICRLKQHFAIKPSTKITKKSTNPYRTWMNIVGSIAGNSAESATMSAILPEMLPAILLVSNIVGNIARAILLAIILSQQYCCEIFTDSALLAGSVIESPCPDVSMSAPAGAVFLRPLIGPQVT